MNEENVLCEMRRGLSTPLNRFSGTRSKPVAFGIFLSQLSIVFLSILLAITNTSQNTRATTWDQEVEISTDVGTEIQFSPHIALEGNNIYTVWSDGEDGEPDIYFRYFDGSTWQPEQKLSPDWGGVENWSPLVAVDGGKIHVLWETGNILDWDIIYTFFDGISWQPLQEINVDVGPAYQSSPSMGVNGDKIHVVWMDDGDGDKDINYRYFNGTIWQPVEEISTDGGTERQSYPSIAVDGDEAHVVWVDLGGGDWDIYYRHFDGVSWQPEMELSTDSGSEWQRQPHVAAYGGKVHVVWVDEGGVDRDIFYRQFNGTSWQPEMEISTDVGMDMQEHPSVVVEGGSVHVTWEDRGDGDFDIYHRFFNGTGWQPEEEVTTDAGTEMQLAARPAMMGGKLHVVWMDQKDGDWDIYYRNGTAQTGDFIPPSSSMNPIIPYWTMLTPLPIDATANDVGGGVANVSLWFRYGVDNTSWNPWELFAVDVTSPWSWDFDFPYGVGFYEFHSVAVDNAGNLESKSPTVEAMAGFADRVMQPSNTGLTLTGTSLEDLTITWDLSPDDGGGNYMVVGYYVFWGSTYKPMGGWSYPQWTFVPPGTTSYVDVQAGEGDPNNYFYSICASDPLDFITCAYDQASKQTRPLSQGVNLISFPLVVADESAGNVLQTVQFDKAWTYDSANGEWKRFANDKPYPVELISINRTMGVWVDVTGDCNLTVAGVVPMNTTIQLYAGWNLIGFPSFDPTYIVADLKAAVSSSRVEGYDLRTPYQLRALGDMEVPQAGYGYWVWVDAATTLILNP